MRPVLLLLLITACLVVAGIGFQYQSYSEDEQEMNVIAATLQSELNWLPPQATLVFEPVDGRPELLAWARLGLIPRMLEERRRSPHPDTLLVMRPNNTDTLSNDLREIAGGVIYTFSDTFFRYYLIDQTE